MDIYINSQVRDIQELLTKKGFTVKRKNNHFSAIKYVKGGRYHILFEFIDGVTFCDFHYDNKIHGIGMGADYGRKPEDFFSFQLKQKFEEKSISFKIKKVNWFTRRNKAIITGFRL